MVQNAKQVNTSTNAGENGDPSVCDCPGNVGQDCYCPPESPEDVAGTSTKPCPHSDGKKPCCLPSDGLSAKEDSCTCLKVADTCACPNAWNQDGGTQGYPSADFPGYGFSDTEVFNSDIALENLLNLVQDSSCYLELDHLVQAGEGERNRKKMDKLNPREQAKQYLATNKIPQMFESLIAALMVVMPDDPVAYIEERMEEIRQIGLDKVNWESFVYHLHPYRHPVRLQLIRDDSRFDKEYTANLLKAQQQMAEEEAAAKKRALEEEEARRKEFEASLLSDDTLADIRASRTDTDYEPDVFQLTETQQD